MNGSRNWLTRGINILVMAGILTFAAPNALLAAQRTFVASDGNDANVCSRISPCRSFAVAMTPTDPGGEVIVLDSAGYGPVVITQSVSIIAPAGVYGGITALAGETGVTVNGAGIRVTLAGLSINGLAGSANGIDYVQGSVLHVERCVISGMGLSGINITGPGELFVKESEIRDVQNQGIEMAGVHDPALLRLTVDRMRVQNNAFNGIKMNGNVRMLLNESIVSGNGSTGIQSNAPNAGDLAEIIIERSAIAHNNTWGMLVGTLVGALGNNRVIVSNTTISWNSTGWLVGNNPNTDLYTRGNNTVRLNGTNQAGKAEIVLPGD